MGNISSRSDVVLWSEVDCGAVTLSAIIWVDKLDMALPTEMRPRGTAVPAANTSDWM